MKMQMSLLAALLFIGSDLLARVAVQGVEQALLSKAMEYGLNGFRAARKLLSMRR